MGNDCNQFTCAINPCSNYHIIDGASVYGLSKTSRIEISIASTDCDFRKINLGTNRCETDVAKPIKL